MPVVVNNEGQYSPLVENDNIVFCTGADTAAAVAVNAQIAFKAEKNFSIELLPPLQVTEIAQNVLGPTFFCNSIQFTSNSALTVFQPDSAPPSSLLILTGSMNREKYGLTVYYGFLNNGDESQRLVSLSFRTVEDLVRAAGGFHQATNPN